MWLQIKTLNIVNLKLIKSLAIILLQHTLIYSINVFFMKEMSRSKSFSIQVLSTQKRISFYFLEKLYKRK